MTEKKPGVVQRVWSNMTVTLAIGTATKAIADWIDRENVTPQQLELWARTSSPVITQLLSQTVTQDANWARGAFGSIAKSMTDNHVWEIVRTLAGTKPEHAAVLADARYWPWFLRQMRTAQQWLGGS